MKFLAFALVLLLNVGCATTTAEMKSTAPWQTWVVDASVETTFRAYKSLAESEFSGKDILWAEGMRTRAHFYGETAEISLALESNPFGKGTYLHFELVQQKDGTRVQVWPFNGLWEKNAEQFKALLPTSTAGAL